MTEPKILFYFESVHLGDEQNSLLALILALDQEKFPFRVLLPSYDGPLPEKLRQHGIEVDALVMPTTGGVFKLVKYYKKLFRYFGMYPFEVVHTDGMQSSFFSIGLKIRFNSNLIWQLWSLAPSGFSLWRFCWLFSVFCDHLIAGCQLVAHRMGRLSKWKNYVSILYRGYDLRVFTQAQSIKRTKEPVLAMFGSLSPLRGHLTFLRALELVRKQYPDCQGRIYVRDEIETDRPYRRELEEHVEMMGLKDCLVIETAWITSTAADGAIGEKISGASIYIDPSLHSETFDSAIIEAMAVGIPVVASRCGVLPEYVLHEQNGLLVSVGDGTAMCEMVVKILSDETLQATLVRNARIEVESRFGISRYLSAVDKLYLLLLKPRSERAGETSIEKKAA